MTATLENSQKIMRDMYPNGSILKSVYVGNDLVDVLAWCMVFESIRQFAKDSGKSYEWQSRISGLARTWLKLGRRRGRDATRFKSDVLYARG